MNYKEFLEEVKNLDVDINPYMPGRYGCKDEDEVIGVYWSTGGTAGNCWDDDLFPIKPDDEKELDELDTILAHFCPGITFLDYKVLVKKIVRSEHYRERDYYGGSEGFMIKTASLPQLHKYLKTNLRAFDNED